MEIVFFYGEEILLEEDFLHKENIFHYNIF